MLGVFGSNLTIFKLELRTAPTSQHGGQTHGTLRPTMLRYVALACCYRLAASLNAYDVKNDLCSFERPFKIQKKGVFLFEISSSFQRLLTFFYYAN